jgi:hypothetical protein
MQPTLPRALWVSLFPRHYGSPDYPLVKPPERGRDAQSPASGCAGRPKGLSLGLLETREAAKSDASRVTLRTVPGTVPKVVLEWVPEPILGTILRPVCTANPTATWRAYRMSTDGLTDRFTPAVSCRLTGRTTSISVRIATRMGTRTGTCRMNLTACLGSPSPQT